MVDEAKAFCPGCGSAFEEKKRESVSEFEKVNPTVQLGQTMYNKMLSDMGLSISQAPNREEKRVESIAPAAPPAAMPAQSPASQAPPPSPRKGWSRKTWILIGVAVFAAGFLFLAIIIVIAAILYFARSSNVF